MKRILSILPMIGAIALFGGLQGCEADVDLKNVDTSIKVNANVAAPIGSMHASLSDFVGDGTWGLFIENGLLAFRDTFSIERKFHNLDLSQYISRTDLKMDVHEHLDRNGALGPGSTIIGTDKQVELRFPMTMKLSGINDDESYQRLDSALIERASFISNITTINNLPLDWEWIDQVTIDLDSRFFHREAGNVVTVYKKGDKGGYGKDMPIEVDQFSLNLMKNPNPSGFKGYWNNVYDSCEMAISMYVTIPKSAGFINIPTGSGFKYNLEVQFIDYKAIWGMFEPSDDMSNQAEVLIADEWSVWKKLRTAKLPFRNPVIDIDITTQIAGALKIDEEYIYVKDQNDQPVHATFNGNIKNTFHIDDYLSVKDSEIGESKTMRLTLNKDPQLGHIDKLFAVHPEKLGYKFSIDFDQTITPQIRITNNTSIDVDAICTLPMEFNQGVTLDYSDTIRGLDLSMLNLDTLLAGVTMIDTLEDAQATLALTFSNELPFQIKGKFTCLDENKNVVIDPKTNKPLLITEKETILIPSPKYREGDKNPQPVSMVETILVDKADLETLRQVKNIVFYAWLDDQSLSEEFKNQADFSTQLRPQDGLRVKIAIGADVEAVLNVLNNEQ